MTSLLSKIFIKNRHDVRSPSVRRAYGTMVSIVGIIVNVLLALFKLLAGTLCGSISITADAVNNLSDAGSQVISLISFKISAKPADRDHPFGHARIEYVASMIVSFLVLLVGFELLKESVAKIISPVSTEFTIAVFIILGISVLAKLWLFIFNRSVAKKINSSVMKATAADSLSDAASTAAVLISALISYFTGFQTDAYMGILVAAIILFAGIKILNETKNSILGTPPDKETVNAVATLTLSYPEILGIHDMVIHNYGAGNTVASLHAEVDGAANIFDTHDVIDNLEKHIFQELGIRATVHMDPIVTDDEKVTSLRAVTLDTVRTVDERLHIHDFRYVEGRTHSNLIFDVVAPFELKMSDQELKREISSAISRIDPTYFTVITIDRE